MELSTEEQKTQLEVEWGARPRAQRLGDGSWAWIKGSPRTQVLPPHLCVENQFRGENSWETDWGLVTKCCGSGTHSLLSSTRLFSKTAPAPQR